MGTPGPTTVNPADIRTLISSNDQEANQGGIYGDLPGESMRMPVNSTQNIGDANGADIQEVAKLHEAKWPQSARDEHKSNGGFFAGPGTSYPLKDATDVEHAAGLYGQADNPSKVKSNIISFAKSHGFSSSLPKAWTEEDDEYGGGYEDPQIQEGHSEIRQLCRIVESQALNPDGHEVRVTVIQGGRSANGYSYDPMALQTIAQMIEGAQAYADHGDPSQTVRSVRDIVGFYRNAQYIPPSGIQPGRVEANLHIVESASWLWDIIKESFQAGQPNLIGLSIDIFGQYSRDPTGVKQVSRIVSLNSCDIVTRPSAGGEFQRILHHQERKGDTIQMDPKDKDKNASTATQDPPADQQTQQNQTPPAEQTTSTPPAPTTTAPPIQTSQITEAEIIQNARLQEQIQFQTQFFEKQKAEMAAAQAEMQRIMEAAKIDRAQVMLERRLQESILPEAVRKQVKSRFDGRIFEEDELNKELQASLDMMASLTSAGIVRGHNFSKETIIGSQITESEKIQAWFDKMFDLDIDPKFGNIKAPRGIREAYARVRDHLI